MEKVVVESKFVKDVKLKEMKEEKEKCEKHEKYSKKVEESTVVKKYSEVAIVSG